jgi:hypothetical protein
MIRKTAIQTIFALAVFAVSLLSVANAQNPIFLPTVTYLTGEKLASGIAVGDFNGDGIPDVATLNSSGYVSIMLGNGDGTFRNGGIVQGKATASIVVADLNHDGRLDLVVGVQGCKNVKAQCVGVLLGKGDGTFKHAVLYSIGGQGYATSEGPTPSPIIVADINGDGIPDLVALNQAGAGNGDGLIGVLIGNGNGTFQPVVTYDSGGFFSHSFALADFNGDGKLDLVVLDCAETGSTNCPATGNMTVAVRLGRGDGTFGSLQSFGTGGAGSVTPTPVAVADVNGDGKPDLLVGNFCNQVNGNCVGDGSVGVLLGKGDGTFATAVTYDSGGYAAGAVVPADLNGDGKLDLVVGSTGLGVLLGNGDGTFQPVQLYPGNNAAVTVVDLDGDGKPDLLGADINGIAALLNNGDGTFGQTQSFFSGGFILSGYAMADLNGDGKPDVVASNLCADQKTCKIGHPRKGTVGVLINGSPAMRAQPR